jgi:ribosomal protein L32E
MLQRLQQQVRVIDPSGLEYLLLQNLSSLLKNSNNLSKMQIVGKIQELYEVTKTYSEVS